MRVTDSVHGGVVWLGILILANVFYAGWGWSQEQAASEPGQRRTMAQIAPTLRLVHEGQSMATDGRVPAPRAALATAANRAGEGPQMVCRVWGPFVDRGRMRDLQARVAAGGAVAEIIESEVAGQPDYLVYVGTNGSTDNAKRILRELKSQSIDSALIRRGQFVNTLSVGVFSRADLATAQAERVESLGYEVGVREIGRAHQVYHLVARVPADFDLGTPPASGCADIAQAHQFL